MLGNASTMASSKDAVTHRVGQVCDTVGAFIEYWGFKAIHGRVWALLALRGSPMTQADIARTLSVSRALVSASIAELNRLGLVRPMSSDRHAPYEAVIDVWPAISDVLRGREWMLLESARLALEATLEELDIQRQHGEIPLYNAERIKLLLTMTELGQTLLKALIALRAPRANDMLRTWASRAALFIQGVRHKIQ